MNTVTYVIAGPLTIQEVFFKNIEKILTYLYSLNIYIHVQFLWKVGAL